MIGCVLFDQGREVSMKPIKKRRSGIDPFYLIIGGALLLMVILVSFTQ
jgi:hypothetical protein